MVDDATRGNRRHFACGDTKDIEQPVSLSYRDSDGHAREPTEAAVVRD
jgi:hypothetical protein